MLFRSDGDYKIDIKEGTQSGTVQVLKGKGVYKVNSNFRGEHHVKIVVDIPKAMNNEQREVIELLKKNFDVTQEYSEKKNVHKKKSWKERFFD